MQVLQYTGYRVGTFSIRVWTHGESVAKIRRDVLDVVTVTEIYAEQGHDDVAVAVLDTAVSPFTKGRIDQVGQADTLKNIHDVKNSSKRGHVLRFYCYFCAHVDILYVRSFVALR